METLEEIIKQERDNRHEEGSFGIKECKKHILEYGVGICKKGLFTLLKEYYQLANSSTFNRTMILACWELINEKYEFKGN